MLAFGALLMGGALLSGLVGRSFLSMTALFVLVGFALGEGGLEWLTFDAGSGFVQALATVALVVILFRDGLEVESEMLQTQWHLPLRKLVLAMPITALVVAAAAHAFTDLGWGECLLIGALLSPTDPVLSNSVVTNPRVPRLVRHSLNLESGLNDGLALPAVLAFSAALRVGEDDFVWWEFVLQDVTLGFAFGIALGLRGERRAAADARPDGVDTGPPEVALRARHGVRDLRHRGRPAARGQRPDRRVRLRDHARHPAAGPAHDVRGAVRGHRRDRQARRVRRVRRAADARRAVRRRARSRRGRRRHAAGGAPGRDLAGAARHRAAARRGPRSWRGSGRRASRR